MSRRPTPDDFKNMKLISILMLVAKLQQGLLNDSSMDAEAAGERAAKGYESLMKQAFGMFPNPSELEQEVLAFGKRLGYQIEQQYLTKGSTTPQ